MMAGRRDSRSRSAQKDTKGREVGSRKAYHSGFMVTALRSAGQVRVLKYALRQMLRGGDCNDKGMAEG